MQVNAITASLQAQAPRVSGVNPTPTVANVLAAYRANPTGVAPAAISDTAANISANFDALTAMGAKLTGITVTGSTQLNLTAAQFNAGTATLAKIKTANVVANVSKATIDQVNSLTANKRVRVVDVEDSAANLSAGFDRLFNAPAKIGTITQVGVGNLNLTGDQFKRGTALNVLSKINGGNNYTLALRDVRASDLTGMQQNSRIASIAVRDTSAQLSTNLASNTSTLSSTNSKVTSITQSDPAGAISVTYQKFQSLAVGGGASIMSKLGGGASLAVTGVKAADAATVANEAKVKAVSITDTASAVLSNYTANTNVGASPQVAKISAITVEDTAANLSSNFSALLARESALSKLKLTDTQKSISLTAAELSSGTALLAKVHGSNDAKGNYSLTVNNVTAANVAATAKVKGVSQVNVVDDVTSAVNALNVLNNAANKVNKIQLTGQGAAIASRIDLLDRLGSKLEKVTNSNNGSMEISFDQYVNRGATLAKVDGGSFNVSGVSASSAKSVAADSRVNQLKVRDSASRLSTAYSDLNSVLSDITEIKLSDSGQITLKKTDYDTAVAGGAASFLNKTKDSLGGTTFSFHVTDVAAADAAALASANKVGKISLKDSSANIGSNLTALTANVSKLGDIYQTGVASAITITAANLASSAEVLNKIVGNYSLDVTGAAAGNVSALSSNAKITKISVADTAAQISINLAALDSQIGKLKGVTVSDYGQGGTNHIDINASDLATYAGVLSKVDAGAYSLKVKNASVAQAISLDVNNAKVAELTISDTGSSVGAKLSDLNTLKNNLKLTAITLTDPQNTIVLTDTQYADNGAAALTILNGGNYKLSVTGVSAADAANPAKNVNADAKVESYSVKANGADIVSNLPDLHARVKLQSITWNDTGTPLEITGDDYVNRIGTLLKINGGSYDAHVDELKAADVATAQADANVSQFKVKDTAANLGKNISALESAAAGNKLQDIVLDGVNDVALTYAEWDGSTTALGIMATNSITWTVSGVLAIHVATVAGDAQLASMIVSDTAAGIVSKLGDSQASGDIDGNTAKISAIKVNDNLPLALTSSQYLDNATSLALLSNTDGTPWKSTVSDLGPADVASFTADNHVLTFTVKGSAAALGANFADLVAAGSKLTSITQDDADPIDIPLANLVSNAQGYAATLNKFTAPPQIKLV